MPELGELAALARHDWTRVAQQLGTAGRVVRTAMPPPQLSRELYEAERMRLAQRAYSLATEGLRLYEPILLGEQVHRCNALWTLLDGSNRAGKTLCADAECAYALAGCHPYHKYPKRNGRAWFVGLKGKHIAMMYNNLFREGVFKIIDDEITGLPRPVRWDREHPNQLQAYDEAYREKWRDAPPLIPKRMIVKEAWESASEGVPAYHQLVSGWEILWSSSLGTPEQSRHYNLVRFDEEMSNPEHYKEAHRGLTRLWETVKQRPKGLWSATSQVSNPELADLRDKADAVPNGDFCRRFIFLLEDMPYISPEARREFAQGYNEDEQLIRVKGIPASAARAIYPTYDPKNVHGCEPFEIPADWCVWAFLDPGRMHCATILAAVDPEEKHVWVFAGFDLRNQDAHAWAEEMKARQNGRKYEGIVCDMRRGRQHLDQLWNKTVAEQYWEALEMVQATPRSMGPGSGMAGFFPGCDDVEGREKALLHMLAIRSAGPFVGMPILQIFRGQIPALDKQIRRAHAESKNPEKRYKDNGDPSDLVECAEYMAAFNPRYHMPEPAVVSTMSPVAARWQREKRQKALARATGRRSHILIPSR